ncbi:MAG: F0F1 ATP synthase subunit B [Planctomycetaceae bacterium]|nr:F0F1 ATP synthase subunit B [Planctomycetaceae bacterium]
MSRSFWFTVMTILGLACFTDSRWELSLRADDAATAVEAKTSAEADHPEKEHAESEHGKADHHEADHGDPAHDAGTHEEGHGEAAHGEEGHGGGAQGPMEWSNDLALWTLITFIVFLIVLKAVAWKPLMSALESRETGIMNNVQGANKARVEAEKALADYQSKLQKAEDEVRQLLADARKAAENARAEMLAATQKEVAAVKDRALAEIDQVRVQALEELFGHMATTVTKATEQVIRRSLTPADQDRLVSEAVAQFAKR